MIGNGNGLFFFSWSGETSSTSAQIQALYISDNMGYMSKGVKLKLPDNQKSKILPSIISMQCHPSKPYLFITTTCTGVSGSGHSSSSSMHGASSTMYAIQVWNYSILRKSMAASGGGGMDNMMTDKSSVQDDDDDEGTGEVSPAKSKSKSISHNNKHRDVTLKVDMIFVKIYILNRSYFTLLFTILHRYTLLLTIINRSIHIYCYVHT